ncbi:hypothetical protein Taro_012073 [Colocasia esculenta]|uniref:Uncharacterized protein n=1 Tax=Colocasia esculenta TaxID=4460 RepID=A0A843UBX5_COLES|nr:hypothetical protein [Colocasia esculenta]
MSFSLGCSMVSIGVSRVAFTLCPTPLVSTGVVCAEGCFRSVPDPIGFYESRVCGPTSVGGRGVALFSSAA